MCLTTKDPTIKRATKDIYVYKYCEVFVSTGRKVTSTFRRFTYIKNVPTNEVQLNVVDGAAGFPAPVSHAHVHEGYHSYNHVRMGANCLFVIPAGADYIDGWFNDRENIRSRVSSKIVYKRKLTWVERLVYKFI